MQDETIRERQAAELAYEQIGEQELAAYVRDNIRTRIADLRSRLPRLFATNQHGAGKPPQRSAAPESARQEQEQEQ